MRTIPLPAIDSLKAFVSIASCKNAATRKSLMDSYSYIESRYLEYSTHQLDLAVISPSSLSAITKAALLHCYANETNELQKMKASLKENHMLSVGIKCQFCGIENISTYDHYLPKEVFPDFSVHALNLIPCCSTCNNKKRSAFLTPLNERAIINLYFESLPEDQYLFAEIIYKKNTPIANFFLDKPPSYSAQEFRLVSEHYKRLNLLERYRESSSEVLSEAQVSIISHGYANTDKLVRDWLRTEAKNISEKYSKNNWKFALFLAMANCDEFVHSCL